MGGKTDLDRVVAYIPRQWKQELEAWADDEERSVSWMVAKLIEKALKERRQGVADQDPQPDDKVISLRRH
ncbi:MAG: CopG family transcriptional regulator [Cyanobacteriota bacterium]